jgi:hypothetical protein
MQKQQHLSCRSKHSPDTKDHSQALTTKQSLNHTKHPDNRDVNTETQNKRKIILNALKSVPTRPMKERQGDGLQLKASNLQNFSPLFFREDRPTSDPEHSPKDHLQDRFIM